MVMSSDGAKQWVLGSVFGRALMSWRSRRELMQAARQNPECVGTVANDQLATLLVTRLPQPKTIFVDVGAHIGSIISEVACQDPTVSVIAVEAMPDKAARLRKKFPAVTVHASAVGERAGTVPFFVRPRQSGFSSLSKPGGQPASGPAEDVQEVQVPIQRLDELISAGGVDVMKIDVEGAELGVLRGCPEMIAASRPVIMFESGPRDADGLGYTKPLMWRFFSEHDYTLHIPNRVAHNDEGLSEDGFVDSHVYPRRTTNYIAIPRERRVAVRDRARAILGISAGD